MNKHAQEENTDRPTQNVNQKLTKTTTATTAANVSVSHSETPGATESQSVISCN